MHGSCRKVSYFHFLGTSQIQAKKFGFLSKCPLVTGAIKGSPPAPHPLAHRLRVPQEGRGRETVSILGIQGSYIIFCDPSSSPNSPATVCPTVCLGCVRKIPSMESGGACVPDLPFVVRCGRGGRSAAGEQTPPAGECCTERGGIAPDRTLVV